MYNIDNDRIYSRKVKAETVLLDMDTGFYYTLDEVGGIIWKMIVSNKDLDQIIAKIVSEYEIDEETATKDIKALLNNLKKEDLIKAK